MCSASKNIERRVESSKKIARAKASEQASTFSLPSVPGSLDLVRHFLSLDCNFLLICMQRAPGCPLSQSVETLSEYIFFLVPQEKRGSARQVCELVWSIGSRVSRLPSIFFATLFFVRQQKNKKRVSLLLNVLAYISLVFSFQLEIYVFLSLRCFILLTSKKLTERNSYFA